MRTADKRLSFFCAHSRFSTDFTVIQLIVERITLNFAVKKCIIKRVKYFGRAYAVVFPAEEEKEL